MDIQNNQLILQKWNILWKYKVFWLFPDSESFLAYLIFPYNIHNQNRLEIFEIPQCLEVLGNLIFLGDFCYEVCGIKCGKERQKQLRGVYSLTETIGKGTNLPLPPKLIEGLRPAKQYFFTG